MTPLTHTLLVVIAYWAVIYAINHILHLLPFLRNRYIKCQESFGLHMTFGYMRCYTKRFNTLCKLWGYCCHRPLARLWFNAGIFIGLGLMVVSLLVLIYSLYQTLFGNNDSSEQVLTPIMPGVNLPWNQIIYYFVTLLVCGVFHELGHALAAVTEQVRINGFGLFILFLYPGAFVDLHSDHLTVISPLRQLRIYTAGVWHNVILVGVALLCLLTTPYLLAPFYTTGHGAVVTMVTRDSVLWDKLRPGTAIVQIDSCPITKGAELVSCMEGIRSHKQKGYCMSKGQLMNHKWYLLNETSQSIDGEGGRECCDSDHPSDICFSISISPSTIKTKSISSNSPSQFEHKYICLTARHVVSDDKTCTTNDDCTAVQSDSLCVTPAISHNSHLIKIKHTSPSDPILYLGDLNTLLYSIQSTDYNPLYSFLPIRFPNSLETLLTYIASLSAALALLNIIPAYALDGHWTLIALLEYAMPENVHRTKIVNIILIFGSTLLILNILLAFWILFNW